jgi:bacterioferritin (cytochrome b1)
MGNEKLVTKLNEALGWELRAINMYAHYVANIRGIHRIQLSPLFKSEVDESIVHADTVRNAIVKNDGIAVTERNPEPILHTTDYTVMIEESLKTEMQAAIVYGELMKMLEDDDDKEIYDAVEQIYLSEVRSIEQMRLLMS